MCLWINWNTKEITKEGSIYDDFSVSDFMKRISISIVCKLTKKYRKFFCYQILLNLPIYDLILLIKQFITIFCLSDCMYFGWYSNYKIDDQINMFRHAIGNRYQVFSIFTDFLFAYQPLIWNYILYILCNYKVCFEELSTCS